MTFDRDTARWSILGKVADVRRSDERKAIIEVLGGSSDPLTPKAIADATERPVATIRRLLYGIIREEPPPIRKAGNAYTLTAKAETPDAQQAALAL